MRAKFPTSGDSEEFPISGNYGRFRIIGFQEFYNITIMENATIPSNILQVKATDSDYGLNGTIYSTFKIKF